MMPTSPPVIAHASGRHIVPVDNAPAQWAFACAVLGERPSLDEIRCRIDADQVPVAMMLGADEARSAKYHECAVSTDGWKVAHIDPVRLRNPEFR
jgi:hypothetical protein